MPLKFKLLYFFFSNVSIANSYILFIFINSFSPFTISSSLSIKLVGILTYCLFFEYSLIGICSNNKMSVKFAFTFDLNLILN